MASCPTIAGPDRTLVLGTSAGLPFGDILIRSKWRHGGALADSFHIALRESTERAGDAAIRFHQKQGRNIGDAKGVAGRIVLFGLIEQGGKRYAEALVESFGGREIVLRYSDDLNRPSGGQPLKVRKSELADRAADLVKREQRRPFGKNLLERNHVPAQIL